MSARLLAIFGFWWSVLVLVYSTRTAQLAVAPLWDQLGVDAVGQAIVPVAFFFSTHLNASILRSVMAHGDRLSFRDIGLYCLYSLVVASIVILFAFDHYGWANGAPMEQVQGTSILIGFALGFGLGVSAAVPLAMTNRQSAGSA